MTDSEPTGPSRRRQRLAGAVGLLLVGGISGGILAATNSALASSPAANSTSVAAGPAAPGAPGAADSGRPADSSTPVRPGEKALTGTNLASATAAALKAVPGGTVLRVETDADGATYEAHMTKADGARVTVKFDKSFKVTAVQQGMGGGGRPGPADGTSAAPSGGSV